MVNEKVKIEDLTIIRPGSKIGKNSTIKCGAIIATNVEVGENTFVGPGVITLHQNPGQESTPCKIGNNCFIGGGAVLLPNAILKDNVIIGAGAVVLPGIYEEGTYVGNPARKIK